MHLWPATSAWLTLSLAACCNLCGNRVCALVFSAWATICLSLWQFDSKCRVIASFTGSFLLWMLNLLLEEASLAANSVPGGKLCSEGQYYFFIPLLFIFFHYSYFSLRLVATDGCPQRKENKPLIQRSLNSLECLIFLKLLLKRTSAVLFILIQQHLMGRVGQIKVMISYFPW